MGQVRASGPSFQHLALMARDIDASHRFYTEALTDPTDYPVFGRSAN